MVGDSGLGSEELRELKVRYMGDVVRAADLCADVLARLSLEGNKYRLVPWALDLLNACTPLAKAVSEAHKIMADAISRSLEVLNKLRSKDLGWAAETIKVLIELLEDAVETDKAIEGGE